MTSDEMVPPQVGSDEDRVELLQQIDQLREAYRQADKERVELRAQVDRLHGLLDMHRSAAEDLERDRAALEERQLLLRSLLLDHRNSRVYRAMVRLGRWRPFELRVQQALGECRSRPAPPGSSKLTWAFETYGPHSGRDAAPVGPIAVDLTALRPGGENGGAKLVATGLVRACSRLAPERDFLLLTSEACHDELAELDGPNVRRRVVSTEPTALSELLSEEPLALLFCPMTAPPWTDPRVPLVCQVNDLQYLTYPEFFEDVERAARQGAFRRAVRWSDRLVTGSHYVKRTILENSSLDEEQVVAVYNGLADRLPELTVDEVEAVLDRYGLERERFLLYPANFWPHKNHRMLLTGFGQFRHRHPEIGLQLVLTGAERPTPEPIVEAIRRMGLRDAVVLAGYVPETDLAAFLRACRALVFPSLYEGFGMPVVEAMACGRPVASSNVTSLVEVAGDAALYFDPRKPAEIADAIARITSDGELVEELRGRGRTRVRELGGSEDMARAYLDVIEETIAAPRRFRDRLAGIYDDGWTSARFVVSHAGKTADPVGYGGRELELGLSNRRAEAVVLEAKAGPARRRVTLQPRQSLVLHCRLPGEPGCLELKVSPTFSRTERGPFSGARRLGLELWACRLSGDGGETDLLATMQDD